MFSLFLSNPGSSEVDVILLYIRKLKLIFFGYSGTRLVFGIYFFGYSGWFGSDSGSIISDIEIYGPFGFFVSEFFLPS